MKNKLTWGLISEYRQEIMGLACLWVVFHHNIFDWPTVLSPLHRIASYGNCGVDMFLFLSGVSLYFAYNKKPGIKRFYAARYVRLLIPFLIMAVPYWIWRDVFLHKGNFICDLSMLSFITKGVKTTWYIGCIAVLYLIYPLIYKLFFEDIHIGPLKPERNTVTILCAAFAAGVCLVVKAAADGFYENIEIALTRTVVFIVGCRAGRWVFEKKPLRKEWLWFSFVYVLFYWFAFRTTVKLPAYWIRMSYVPFAVSLVLLCAWVLNIASFGFARKVLIYFGDRSLEIYLSHVMIRNVFIYYFPDPILDRWGIINYAIIVVLSLIVSEPIHRCSKVLGSKLLKKRKSV